MKSNHSLCCVPALLSALILRFHEWTVENISRLERRALFFTEIPLSEVATRLMPPSLDSGLWSLERHAAKCRPTNAPSDHMPGRWIQFASQGASFHAAAYAEGAMS